MWNFISTKSCGLIHSGTPGLSKIKLRQHFLNPRRLKEVHKSRQMTYSYKFLVLFGSQGYSEVHLPLVLNLFATFFQL